MSILRLSGFVLSLLLLASLSALASPGKVDHNTSFSKDFTVTTGQGRMQDGIAMNELARVEVPARPRLAVSPTAMTIVPLAGENIPEMGQ